MPVGVFGSNANTQPVGIVFLKYNSS